MKSVLFILTFAVAAFADTVPDDIYIAMLKFDRVYGSCERVKVVNQLIAKGDRAVLPLIEILESPNYSSLQKMGAEIALGMLGDKRAVPALESKAKGSVITGELKSYAAFALKLINGEEERPSKVYLMENQIVRLVKHDCENGTKEVIKK